MAIPVIASATASQSVSTGTTAPATPDGNIGDYVVWAIGWGTSTSSEANRPTLTGTAAARAVYVGSDFGTDGAAWGVDTGSRWLSYWYVLCESATGTNDALTFTQTGSGTDRVASGQAFRITHSAGTDLTFAVTFGKDSTKADSYAATGMTNIGFQTDDLCISALVITPDTVNPTLAIAIPGCTLTNAAINPGGAVATAANTNGNDQRMNVRQVQITAGTSSGAPTATYATTGSAGVNGLLRIREVPATQTLTPTAIGSGEAFGSHTATISSGTLVPTAIPSAEAFGTLVLGTSITSTPTGVGTAEAFGTPVRTSSITLTPTAIATLNAFGLPVAAQTVTVIPTGIASLQAFGTHALYGTGVKVAATRFCNFNGMTEGASVDPSTTATGSGNPVDAVTGGSTSGIGLAAAAAFGARGVRITQADGQAKWLELWTINQPQDIITARVYIRLRALPTTAYNGFFAIRTSTAGVIDARVQTDGKLTIQDAVGSNKSGAQAPVLQLDNWYHVCMACQIGTTTSNGKIRAWVRDPQNNDALIHFIYLDNANTGTVVDIDNVRWGKTASAGAVDMDIDSIGFAEDSLAEILGLGVLGGNNYEITIHDTVPITDAVVPQQLELDQTQTDPVGITDSVTTHIVRNVYPTGIPSAQAMGSHTATQPALQVNPTGIPSAEAVGTPTITQIGQTSPTGIPSAFAAGVHTVGGNVNVTPTGIASAQAFGVPVRTSVVVVNPTGIPSAEVVATPTVVGGVNLGFSGFGIPLG